MARLRSCVAAVALLALTAAACGDDDDDAAPPPERASGYTPSESQRRAPMPAPPRTEVVGAWWDDKVVVLSGYLKDGTASAQVDFYDRAGDTWTSGPPIPTALHHTAVGVLDGRLYVVGGYEAAPEGWKPVAEVHSLGPGETAWRAEPSLMGPRGALAVASTGSALVAVGGTGTGDDALVRTEFLQSGATEWERGPDMHIPREHLAATALGPRVYAIGGRQGSLEGNRRAVESFAIGDDSWTTEPELNHARGGIGAATVGQAPCVAGGEAPQGTIAPVECLFEGRWQMVADLKEPRHGVAVVASPPAGLHVIGGGPQPGLFVSDTHEYFDFVGFPFAA